jgi:hypothetical protein
MSDGGLCLEAPRNENKRKEEEEEATSAMRPQPPMNQRVVRALTNEEQAVALTVRNVPTISDLRVSVTATNGVPTARINEIRAYTADGVGTFPSRV